MQSYKARQNCSYKKIRMVPYFHQVVNELKHPSSGQVIRRCLGQIFVVSTSDTYICRSTVASTIPVDLPGLLALPYTPKNE